METFRTRRVLDGSSLVLIVVESVVSACHRSSTSCRFAASVAPVAVVVCKPAGARALGVDGSPVDLDELRRKAPVLDEDLASFAVPPLADRGVAR